MPKPALRNESDQLKLQVRPFVRRLAAALVLALGTSIASTGPAHAACSPTLVGTGSTVICNTRIPNPAILPITTLPGATDVTVIMEPGAELHVPTIGVTLGGGGQITNNGGQIVGVLGGIRDTGPIAITNSGEIIGDFAPAIVVNGHGTSTIDNTGTITGNAAAAININTVAGSTITLNNMSGGSIDGGVTGSGFGSTTIINSGNFDGDINLNGTGFNSLTANSNINGAVFMGGAQNTVVNAALLNSGLVLNASVSNTVTNSAGATIVRRLDIDGPGVETVTNAGTINATVEMEGSGSLFNSGTINSSQTAVLFEGHPGPFTLTLAPGFVINGRVLGTGDDTLQLGGSGTGSFNVSNIGAILQYRGFNDFNKIGASTWTLTGIGAQDWNILSGTLIGDTNSLNGDIITDSSALVFDQSNTGRHAGTIVGTGNVTIQGGGTVVFTGDNTYTGGTTISGSTLQIDNGGVSGSVVGNIVLTGTAIQRSTLAFDRSDNFVFGGSISGSGAIRQIGTGSTTLQGNSGAFNGTTTVAAGTFAVDGTLGTASSTLAVNSGGTLTGTGTVGGAVTVNGAGTLSGTQGMTLTTGPLTLGSGSIIDAALGTPGTTAPLFNVNGPLTLAGTLNVTDLGGFGAGVYRLVNYTGALTDNGVAIGTLPPGTNAADLSVQTATPQQVNLVNTGGQTLQFWDGPNGHNNGVIDGGSGTWDAVNANWTNEIGTVNGSWTTHFAIFEGAPGAVTVDNSKGVISAIGMQFAVDGYHLNGDTLTLAGSSPIIRVGDGTEAGAGFTATIDNVLAGSGSLVKTDLGTLVLGGANTYAEGTLIEAGTISISSDANLGGTTGGLTFANGALETTANLTTNRPVFIAQHASFVTAAGTSLVLNDLVFGPGGLSEDGAGTLVLTRNDTFLGGTHINSGTVQLGNGGASGSVMGDIEDNGTLAFDRPNTLTEGGVISGTGGVRQIGSGTTVLTGVSTYAGSTIVASGGLTVHGALTGTSAVSVGDGGAATLLVETGGEINSGSGVLGNLAGTTGTAIVTDANSIWANTGTLTIGNAGTGTLIISDQARLTAADVVIAAQPGSTGTLIVGTPPGEAPSLTAGTLFPPTITFGAGNGTLVFNHAEADLDYSFDSTLSGPGTIRMIGPGTTVFTADSSAFSGTTAVNAGALDIEGSLGGPTSTLAVNPGGTLTGGGMIGGAVTVNSGGTLAGIAGQVLTTGPLTLNSGSNINVVLGTPESAGLFNVNGPLTLAGTLNVADLGGFGPGTYRLFNYTGAFTDNGVAFGTLPPGTTPASLTVQTSVAQQVNLVNSTGVMLQFWDGPSGHNDGVIEGGSGTWDTVSQNWTNASGSANAGWQGGFAIFEGAPGTVTVDNNAGAVTATGLQFAVDGYQLTGGTLTLTGSNPIIRVGDGTETGADDTATIDNVLAGAGTLVKTDLGTLVLGGANTYSGGTLINAGTIIISSDANLGAASGGLSFADGALETTASLTTNRSVDILQSASFVTTGGTSLVLNGTVSGPGSLSEDGDGTLILVRDNTYLGGTHIDSGTLQLGNGGSSGSVVGAVSNNGVLAFDRTDTFTFDGSITGSGNVTLIGPGTTVLTAGSPYAGATTIASGNLIVSGALTGTSAVSVGDGGAATLTVETGGEINSGSGVLGNLAGTTGTAIVTDANSIWTNTGTLTIGNAGTGTLIVSDESNVTASAVVIAEQPGSTGTLIVGMPVGQASNLTPGTLDPPTVTFGAGNGTLVFNLSSPAFVFDSTLVGPGTIQLVGPGTTVFTADSSAFSGTTAVNAGTLDIEGVLGGATSTLAVNSGGTLTGGGAAGGPVTVNSGGTLAGIAGQVLTTGPLTLNSGSNINVALGAPETTGLFNVNGPLTLAGTLNVTDLGGFGAGTYRLFNYTGALTDNGVAFGTLPPGTTPASLTVQTSVAQQVNLVNSTGVMLQFWDGPGTPNDGVVNGGTGTWDAVNQNWTNAGGTVNGSWATDFAIFAGTPGTVTVDNSTGAISTTGMQFAVDGYTVTGGTLTLAGTAPDIRVGDGTAAGAGYTATIDSVFAGSGELVKTDLGTLVLGGANTYSGGTLVEGGTISISSDANLGAASSGLSFANGVLETTANVVTSRAVNVLQSATFETNPNTTLELDGAISGAGVLTKSGAGTLLVTGTANQAGGTIITAGALQLGNGGTSGALAGNVTNNGSFIINRSDAYTFAGDIIGTGSFTQAGTGATILTGTSDYAGGTTIAAGALQIGNGGTSGAIVGNVVNDSVFIIDRSDNFTFNGAISGAGAVVQRGTGAITIAGAIEQLGTGTFTTGGNTFTGGLTILGGAIVIGDGNTSGTYAGNIVDDATLAFDREDVLTYAGAISGTGVIEQNGAGTTILTGNSGGFSGSTAVNSGTLAVNGKLGSAASTLAVNNGGTLAGTGTIGGSATINAGGTLSPGGQTLGKLTVGGNLTFAPGSIYRVDLTPAATDLVVVGGQAKPAGEVQVFIAPGDYLPNTVYPIVTATGGVSGTFDSLDPPPSSAFFEPVLRYDANDVYLVLTDATFMSVAQTPNQLAVANAIATLPPTSPVFLAAFNLSTDAEARQAFDLLSGEAYASTAGAMLEESRYVRDAVLARLRGAYDVQGAPHADAVDPPAVGAWFQGLGAFAGADGDGNAADLTRTVEGAIAGYDIAALEDWRVGAAGAYLHSALDVDARASHSTFDSFDLALYGAGQIDQFMLRAGAAYAWQNVTMRRTVVFPGFSDSDGAHYRAPSVQGFGEVGYDVVLAPLLLEPFGNAAYVSVDTHGFGESGGGAALAAPDQSLQTTFTTAGLHASSALGLVEGMPMSAVGTLGWQHAFGDVTPTETLAFLAGGTPFTIAGVPLARNTAVVEGGVNFAVTDAATVSLAYSGQIAGGAHDHEVRASFAWNF
jgi:fibronectin-binding autotransporter adhesin